MTTPCPKNTFPTLLQQFLLERLIQQRNVSPQTVAAYRDSFCLLLRFAQRHLGKAPEQLALADLDAPLMLAFLNYLENERHNKVRGRNARFTAIRSFLHFAAFMEPAALPVIQRVLGRRVVYRHPRASSIRNLTVAFSARSGTVTRRVTSYNAVMVYYLAF
jgi:site-specific recombinase XerD